MSNLTDIDALAAEPGVEVVVTTNTAVIATADLAIVPGTRSTVHDLVWLRQRGLDTALASRAQRQGPVLGLCGGYQMLATTIEDPVESGCGRVEGLGMLPVAIRFSADKVLARPNGHWHGYEVRAYEIHHGIAELTDEADAFLDGCRVGQVWGTMWHGALENDGFRRAWLAEIAAASGSLWRPQGRRAQLRGPPGSDDQQAGRRDRGQRGPGVDSWRCPVKIRVLVIGIGTGNLDHLTGEAVAALNEVDLFLVADKGPAKRDLAALRTTICQTFIEHDYRLIEVPDPERDRSPDDYSRAVRDWHAARTAGVCDDRPPTSTGWGHPGIPGLG